MALQWQLGQQHEGSRQVIVLDEIKAEKVRCLAGCDVRSHRQSGGIHPEVDLGREATL